MFFENDEADKQEIGLRISPAQYSKEGKAGRGFRKECQGVVDAINNVLHPYAVFKMRVYVCYKSLWIVWILWVSFMSCFLVFLRR